MQQSDLAEFFTRIIEFFDLLSRRVERLFNAAIENRMEYVFFAFEVEIDSAVGNAGLARDVGNLGVEVTVVRKHTNGRAQDCFTLIADSWREHCLMYEQNACQLALNDASLSFV